MTRPAAPPLTDAERAVQARFDAAPVAPEANDDGLWATLHDLIPCSGAGECVLECECAQGELRLAVQRLIVAERIHAADCEGWECCTATSRRARLVEHAATPLAPVGAAGGDRG